MFIDELFAQIIKEPIVTKSRITVSHGYVCTREKWKSKIRGDVGVCGGKDAAIVILKDSLLALKRISTVLEDKFRLLSEKQV